MKRTGGNDTGEAVLLLHGIWMTGLEMGWLGRRLSRQGYRVSYYRYHSLGASAAENARRLSCHIDAWRPQVLHLVAHSLGGIVLLHLFAQNHRLPPGRVVLLGSPVSGSGVAARMAGHPLLGRCLGHSIDRALLGGAPAWDGSRDLGVIAGTRRIGVGRLVGGAGDESDGTVAVAETRVEGARDFRLLRVSHMGMLFSPAVAEAVAKFLRTGRFR
jgi:pimeloyl-ACP methyl ester carboxylesterase